jgi:hypothetical protein
MSLTRCCVRVCTKLLTARDLQSAHRGRITIATLVQVRSGGLVIGSDAFLGNTTEIHREMTA